MENVSFKHIFFHGIINTMTDIHMTDIHGNQVRARIVCFNKGKTEDGRYEKGKAFSACAVRSDDGGHDCLF